MAILPTLTGSLTEPRALKFFPILYIRNFAMETRFSADSGAAASHIVSRSRQVRARLWTRKLRRMVSGNYFTALGLKPAAGRLFFDSDDTAENANPVVVLSYGYWRTKFALSPSIIGHDIRLNGYPFTVVGVAPPGFDGDVVGEQMELYVPLSMQPEMSAGGMAKFRKQLLAVVTRTSEAGNNSGPSRSRFECGFPAGCERKLWRGAFVRRQGSNYRP